MIDDYKIVTKGSSPGQEDVQIEQIKRKMSTRMQSKCEGSCCLVPNVQPNALNHQASSCECYRLKVECGALCSCDPTTCNNRQMSLK